jgi:flagellar P-ring protein precursor FlgI
LKKVALLLLFLLLTTGVVLADEVEITPIVNQPETRIKELVTVVGVRTNIVTGVGVVVGLNGTGDSSRFAAGSTIMANTLRRFGLNVNSNELKSRNIAVVTVSAKLPPFAREGDLMDVEVASIGDARSLQGGFLMLTPLQAGESVYALAQGPLSTGGFSVEKGGSSANKNPSGIARIPNGATVEESIDRDFDFGDRITLSLNNKDFTTANRIAYVINQELGEIAVAKDAGTVEVLLKESYIQDPVGLISSVENLMVIPDTVAKVVINERTGTVVFGAGVKISAVAIAQGGLKVEITSQREVSQPLPLSDGKTVVVENTTVQATEKQANTVVLQPNTSVGDLVDALNAIGATPRDIISIIQAMKEAGALYGVLEII